MIEEVLIVKGDDVEAVKEFLKERKKKEHDFRLNMVFGAELDEEGGMRK